MENQDQLPEEEITNLEQFQVGRTPDEQEEKQNSETDPEEAGYTPGETEFADGDGTRLDQEIEELEIDPETDDLEELEAEPESTEEDADFENPDDDPA